MIDRIPEDLPVFDASNDGLFTMARLQRRYEQDPALVMLTEHYAKALMVVLPMLPEAMKASTSQSVIVQTIQDWEDIHKKFDDQLKPAS